MAYDFPDFLPSRQPVVEPQRFFDATVTVQTTIPAIDCTIFDEVVISVTNLDAGAIFELQIGLITAIVDPTPVPVYNVVFNPGQSGHFRIPCLRQQLQIIVVPHGPVATQHLQVAEYGMTSHTSLYDLYNGKHLIFQESPALGANGTNTTVIPTWYHGEAMLSVNADAPANAQIVLDYWESANGTFLQFAQFGIAGLFANQPQRVTFPPNPVRVRLFNGATAQTIDVFITASSLGNT